MIVLSALGTNILLRLKVLMSVKILGGYKWIFLTELSLPKAQSKR